MIEFKVHAKFLVNIGYPMANRFPSIQNTKFMELNFIDLHTNKP